MKKIITIGIFILFMGMTLASAGALSTNTENIDEQETQDTYPLARIEMKDGKLKILEGYGSPAPLMFLSLMFSKLTGRDGGVILFLSIKFEVIEGELIVKPRGQEEIPLYQGDQIYMKTFYTYFEHMTGPEFIDIVKGVAFGVTI